MGNIVTGNVAEILVAQARILIAPKGTAAPIMDAATGVWTWDAAFKEVGYTQKGTDLTYTPTKKGITVDEELGDVAEILTAEKLNLSAILSQATLKNINYAMAAAKLTTVAAGVGTVGTSQIDLGSGALQEWVVGLEGLSPQGKARVFVGWRGMAGAAVKLAQQKTVETVVPFSIDFLVDSSKALGQRLCFIKDVEAAAA